MAVRKVDWRQRRCGQTMRKMSQKSRQGKTIPQTRVVIEEKERNGEKRVLTRLGVQLNIGWGLRAPGISVLPKLLVNWCHLMIK